MKKVALVLFLVACGGPADQGADGAAHGSGVGPGATNGANGGAANGSTGAGGSSEAGDGDGATEGSRDDGAGGASTPAVPVVTYTAAQLFLEGGETSRVENGRAVPNGPPLFTSKLDNANPVDGAASFLVTGAAGNTAQNCVYSGLLKDIDASYSGKRLRMRQKVKTEDVTAVSLELRIDRTENDVDRSGVYDDMKTPPDRTLHGTTPWQEIALVLDVPDGSTEVITLLHVCGTGRAWFGPTTVEVVPSTVPTTPHVTWGYVP